MGKKIKKKVEVTEEVEKTVGMEPEVLAAEEEPSRDELQQAQDELRVVQDQYLRTLADMDNLRKRTQREKEDLAKYANENILREILPVVDNLERAVEHAEQTAGGEGLLEGVQMTLEQFSQVLSRSGIEPVLSIGIPFDPAHHQAMGQIETEDYPVNCVAQEMQKGYLLNQRLLRPSMVMIAKAPVKPEQTQEQDNSTETDNKK